MDYSFTTIGALIGMAVAIILIIKKVQPAYSLILGALIGGVIGSGNLILTVDTMVSGAQSMISSVLRIMTSGILAGTLIKTGAAEKIAEGIKFMNENKLADVLIIGRGGGSLEDLWPFNEEIVARAIFECRTPVISAVGHEVDYTIADYVADLRAPTPSAAAELAVYDRNQMLQRIRTDRVHLMRSMKSKIAVIQGRMETLKARLMQQSPVYRLNSQKQYLGELQLRLEHGMTQQLDKNKARLRMLAQHFDDISPLKRLGQGYAYVSDSRQNGLKSVSQVSKGEQLQISVKDGTVKARVEEIICQEEIGR